MNSTQTDYRKMLGDTFSSFLGNKKKILVFNLLVILLVTMVILAWPRSYRSEAKIWIKLGRENSKLDPLAATGENISIQETDREDEIMSAMDLLRSWAVADKVVGELGADVVLGDTPVQNEDVAQNSVDIKQPSQMVALVKGQLGRLIGVIKNIDPISDREEAIRSIVKGLRVHNEQKSNVLSIAYDADTPSLARAVVDSVVDQYRHEHTRMHYENESQSFFESQRQSLMSKVEQSADEHRRLLDGLGIASVDGYRKTLETDMMQIRSAKLDAIRSVARADARIERLKDSLKTVPEMVQSQEKVVPNTGRDALAEQMFGVQVNSARSTTVYREGHPKYKLQKQLEAESKETLESEAEAQRKEITQARNSVYQALMMELEQDTAEKVGYEAILNELVSQEKAITKQIAELNETAIQIRRLEQERSLAEESYAEYSQSHEIARIDDELRKSAISNIGVVQPANLQEKPISPSKAIAILAGLMLMFSGTIAITSLGVILSQSPQSPDDTTKPIVSAPYVPPSKQRDYADLLK